MAITTNTCTLTVRNASYENGIVKFSATALVSLVPVSPYTLVTHTTILSHSTGLPLFEETRSGPTLETQLNILQSLDLPDDTGVTILVYVAGIDDINNKPNYTEDDYSAASQTSSVSLATEAPNPSTNMMRVNIKTSTFLDNNLNVSINATKLSGWNDFYNDKELTLYLQIKNALGQVIGSSEMGITMELMTISMPLDYQNTLTDSSVTIEGYVWTPDDDAMSAITSMSLDNTITQTEAPNPSTNMMRVNITTSTFLDNNLNVSINATKLSGWNDFYNDKELILYLQVKDTSGQIIGISELSFFMGTSNLSSSLGYQNTLTDSSVTIEGYVWTPDDDAMSAITSMSLDNTVTSTPDTGTIVTTDMVLQSVGYFEITSDNRVTGDLLLSAGSTFPDAFNDDILYSFVQFSDALTGTVYNIKTNEFSFTQNTRGVRIDFDESAYGSTNMKIDFYVSKTNDASSLMSINKTQTIQYQSPGVEPCPTGYHRVYGVCVLNDVVPVVPVNFDIMKYLKGILALTSVFSILRR